MIRVTSKTNSNLALSDAEDNTSVMLNRSGIADLPLPLELGKDSLFCSPGINKFSSFKNPFAMFTRLSELHFICRRSNQLVLTKETTSMSYDSSLN